MAQEHLRQDTALGAGAQGQDRSGAYVYRWSCACVCACECEGAAGRARARSPLSPSLSPPLPLSAPLQAFVRIEVDFSRFLCDSLHVYMCKRCVCERNCARKRREAARSHTPWADPKVSTVFFAELRFAINSLYVEKYPLIFIPLERAWIFLCIGTSYGGVKCVYGDFGAVASV